MGFCRVYPVEGSRNHFPARADVRRAGVDGLRRSLLAVAAPRFCRRMISITLVSSRLAFQLGGKPSWRVMKTRFYVQLHCCSPLVCPPAQAWFHDAGTTIHPSSSSSLSCSYECLLLTGSTAPSPLAHLSQMQSASIFLSSMPKLMLPRCHDFHQQPRPVLPQAIEHAPHIPRLCMCAIFIRCRLTSGSR